MKSLVLSLDPNLIKNLETIIKKKISKKYYKIKKTTKTN